jgi:hypothetical protein
MPAITVGKRAKRAKIIQWWAVRARIAFMNFQEITPNMKAPITIPTGI